jgi:hypothetical protein
MSSVLVMTGVFMTVRMTHFTWLLCTGQTAAGSIGLIR